jgi:hypothetical protein
MRGAARAIADKMLEAMRYLLKIAISVLLILLCRVIVKLVVRQFSRGKRIVRSCAASCVCSKFEVAVTIHLDESQDCDVGSVF